VSERFASDCQKLYTDGFPVPISQFIERLRPTRLGAAGPGLFESEHLVMFTRDDLIDASTDQKIRLWGALIVTTLMVAVAAYVLSLALLGRADNPPPHRSAAAFLHTGS